MGSNTFSRLVRGVCIAEKIDGDVSKLYSTTQILRGTLKIHFEHGHSDYSVVKRSSHQDLISLKYYQHLSSTTELQLQQYLAGRDTIMKGCEPNSAITASNLSRTDHQSCSSTATNPSPLLPGALISNVTTMSRNSITTNIYKPEDGVGTHKNCES